MPLPAEKIHYTFADCLTWDEDERIEIISGEVIMMTPPTRLHQKISMEISRQLANFLEGKSAKYIRHPLGSGCLKRPVTRRMTLTRW